MKYALIIVFALTANIAMAQAGDAPESDSAESGEAKVSFFQRVFGRSKAEQDSEDTDGSTEQDGNRDHFETMYLQLEGDFEAYKTETNAIIKDLQEEVRGSQKSIEESEIKISDKIDKNDTKISQSLATLEADIRENHTTLNTKLGTTDSAVAELRRLVEATNSALESASLALNEKIETTAIATSTLGESVETNKRIADEELAEVDIAINQNKNIWLNSILAVALVLVLSYFLFWRSVSKNKRDAISVNQETRRALEEEMVQLDSKLIELIEAQLTAAKAISDSGGDEPGHSLALKVADEIVRIQKNLNRMDEKTRGLKQLAASVRRIQDNFSSNGYEIVEMVGKPYNEGMKVSANFIPDEDMDEGEQVITRVIKPQVNYQEVMIQAAQIEVSIGE